MQLPPNSVIAIVGCTASGKGAVAREIATRLGGEIVSVDSMKIYRTMDIGTAKPAAAHRAAIPHHLIDVADPWDAFSAARYVDLADAAIDDIHSRGKPAIVVGGTIMYFRFLYEGVFEGPSADDAFRAEIRRRAAVEGVEALHAELAAIDPDAAARIHRNDIKRIERALEVYALTGAPISKLQKQWADGSRLRRDDWHWRVFALRRDRDDANRRINARVRRMIDEGLEAEARRLFDDPRGISEPARQAVGYAEWFAHFAGKLKRDEAVERIKINSRRLGKHQRTWLRRFPGVTWIEVAENATVDGVADAITAALHTPN
ncbi:MAG: tRNA (adenosine(37)-N6)-dimethylallyltransferase MiaA [Phycisphaerae bacterium]